MDGKELFYRAADNRLMAAALEAKGGLFEVKTVKPLFGPSANAAFADSYDVSADGQRFLMLVQVGGDTDRPLTVVQNWIAGITRGR